MQTRMLGDGGPEVSVVGLGTNNFGRRCDYDQTLAVVDTALDAGVTLFDTADIYGQGMSEDYIGRALEGRRDKVILATKFGMPMDDNPDESRGRPEYVRWAIEGSLRRLRTDVIDVYQMHRPDDTTPIEETLGVLDELVDEGKVRWLGASNFSADQIEEAEKVAREKGLNRFVSLQNEYSLFRREIEEDVLPACERLGIGVLPYFPLASGLLTGKYRLTEKPSEGRLAQQEIAQDALETVERLVAYGEARGISILDVAIGALLAQPAISSVIAGATKPEQVRANVAAADWQPTATDMEELRAIL
jgi:aryl-alcohol dehydrogenase-like predicted oxidoreductase